MAARRSEKIFIDGPPEEGAPSTVAAEAIVAGGPPESNADAEAVPSADGAIGLTLADLADAPPAKRVLSVSPLTDEAVNEAGRLLPGSAAGVQEVFMSPRVVDQQAFDELAAGLRSLLDEAGGSSERLRKLIEQSRDGDRWAGKASIHLQERLRLSARMLKAFQAQIARVDEAVERMGQKQQALETARESMDESLVEFEHHLSATLEKYEKRIGEAADRAIERYDRHLDRHRDRLADIDAHLDDAGARAATTLGVAEEVEVSVTRLAHRTAENAAAIEARRAESMIQANQAAGQLAAASSEAREAVESREAAVAALIERCEGMTARLAETLEAGDHQVEEAAVRCRGLRCALEAKLDQCREAERHFERRLESINAALASLDERARDCDALRQLAARLAPWEKVLIRQQGPQAGLPEAVAAMVDELRGGLGRDLGRLSKTMADLAGRIDDSGIVAPRPMETAELKPHAERSAAAMRSSVGETIGEIETIPDDAECPGRSG